MRTAVLSRRFNPRRTISPPAVKSWFRLAFHHFLAPPRLYSFLRIAFRFYEKVNKSACP